MPRPRKVKPLTEHEVMAAADRAEGKVTPSDTVKPTIADGRSDVPYSEAFPRQAEKLCQLGATDIEVANFFGISDRTLYRWKIKYPELCQALKTGKEAADERVERSLYHKANGYTFESEKIFQFQGEVVRAKTTEHIPPDTVACIFWLKNRRKDLWRDVQKHEHGGVGDFDRMDDAELQRAIAQMQEESTVPASGTEH